MGMPRHIRIVNLEIRKNGYGAVARRFMHIRRPKALKCGRILWLSVILYLASRPEGESPHQTSDRERNISQE